VTTPNTEPKPRPATDSEIAEFFDLLQSFGCETGRVDGKLMGRCSVCFGPWFDPESPDEIHHDPDCSYVTGPSVLARIEQEREMRRELEKVLHAVNGAIAFGLLAELRPYHRVWQGLNDSVMAALARAAKMEADYAR